MAVKKIPRVRRPRNAPAFRAMPLLSATVPCAGCTSLHVGCIFAACGCVFIAHDCSLGLGDIHSLCRSEKVELRMACQRASSAREMGIKLHIFLKSRPLG